MFGCFKKAKKDKLKTRIYLLKEEKEFQKYLDELSVLERTLTLRPLPTFHSKA